MTIRTIQPIIFHCQEADTAFLAVEDILKLVNVQRSVIRSGAIRYKHTLWNMEKSASSLSLSKASI